MNRNDILDLLGSLLKVEYDAIQAYNQAIGGIDITNIREQLILFQNDHERHICILTTFIKEMNEKPFERPSTDKGFFVEGFTPIRSMFGIEGALQAMENDENITNRHYSDALLKELPTDIRTQISEIFGEEQRHLQYVEQALTGRIWEPSETHLM
jgi:rubrerythrin